jgi:hypothetical protein
MRRPVVVTFGPDVLEDSDIAKRWSAEAIYHGKRNISIARSAMGFGMGPCMHRPDGGTACNTSEVYFLPTIAIYFWPPGQRPIQPTIVQAAQPLSLLSPGDCNADRLICQPNHPHRPLVLRLSTLPSRHRPQRSLRSR